MSEPADTPEAATQGRFFERFDWSAFWVTFLITLTGYTLTLAPTVTMEDSGELATAGTFLGIPHPPGYPLWTMISWIFTKLFSFVTFRGQPNPAWGIAFSSAFFGALASALTALLVCRSGRDFIGRSSRASAAVSPRTLKLFCWVGGVSSSLVFAFTSINWSQSVIVEIYALNAFFLMLLMTLAYMWIRRPSAKLLIILSFVFGLSLTNYQALLLMLPALALLVMLKDLNLARDFTIAAIPYGLVFLLIWKTDIIPPLVHPLHYTSYIYISLNFLVIILTAIFLPKGRTVAMCILALELGLLFYAYMPLASDFNPPMNWGYPRTWEGFKHAITRGQYEKIVPTPFFSHRFVEQLIDYARDLRSQFTLPVAILGLLPFTMLTLRSGGRTIRTAGIALGVMLLAWVIIMIEEAFDLAGIAHPSFAGLDLFLSSYLALICSALFLAYQGGWTLVVDQLREFAQKATRAVRTSVSDTVMVVLIFTGLLALYAVWVYGLASTIPGLTAQLRKPAAQANTAAALTDVAIIVSLMLLPFLSSLVTHWLMTRRPQVEPEVEAGSRRWILVVVAGYVVMSILFVLLASPTGDLQDYFVQRVKYISSHALFAILIGYGIIIALFYGLTAFAAISAGNRVLRRLATAGGSAFMLMLPLIPVLENAYNKEQIRTVGGAEQNGHDFGWQFGNYELRGAEAILEELAPDEEPPPNPSYPPEMDRNAIFYGGTDPGRFVPTYMIYAAGVRSDIFLITQNALADNTYMSVMRDLYGNQIWLPDPPEVSTAFQAYVGDIQAGRRPPSANIKVKNGAVQVNGSAAVMEVNGLIAEMIFRRNNWKHTFYLEESMALPWMYPYLEPHGLIMRINRSEGALDARAVINDMDFWDWYTRRLTRNRKFVRDIVARKSFSKLRSSIGGLYARRGRLAEAEKAFQQSRALYPESPEATFRLAQEVLLPQGRIAETIDLLLEFETLDPGNKNIAAFIRQIGEFQTMKKNTQEVEARLASGRATTNDLFKLAEMYLSAGQQEKFDQLTTGILTDSNATPEVIIRMAALLQKAGKSPAADKALDTLLRKTPAISDPELYLNGATIYAMAKNPEKMRVWLAEFLKRRPADWRAWFDMATLDLATMRTNDAIASLETAFRAGGTEAIAVARQNPSFAPVVEKAIQKAGTAATTR